MLNRLSPLGKSASARLAELYKHRPDQTVVIAGSLVTGFGNSRSDLDAYVIGETLPLAREMDLKQYDFHVTVAPDGTVAERDDDTGPDSQVKEVFKYSNGGLGPVHITFLTTPQVEKLRDRVEEVFAKAATTVDYMRGYETADFGYTPFVFLGKLLQGECLANPELFESLLGQEIRSKFCFISYRYKCPTYVEMNDAAGSWEAGDFLMAALFSRIVLESFSWSLSLLTLDTNTNPKWVTKCITAWPERYRQLSQTCLSLLLGDISNEAAQKAFTPKALDTVDELIRACVREQDANPVMPKSRSLLAVFDDYFAGRLTKDANQQDYDWEKRVYGAESLPTTTLYRIKSD